MKQALLYLGIGLLLWFTNCSAHAATKSKAQQPAPAEAQGTQPDANIERMLATAKAQFEHHRLDAAGRTLHGVLDLDPTNQRALYYLGLVARQAWVEAHPDQHRASPQPDKPLPAPTPVSGTPGLIILERTHEGEPLRIANAIPGSPAANAAITSPGFLISVNGTNVVSKPLPDALQHVRGKVGTMVTLEIADSTMRKTNTYTLRRGRLVHENGKLEVVDQ